MANQISLLDYLQQPVPAVPVVPPARPSKNSTSQQYSADDIEQVTGWPNFNVANAVQLFHNMLTQTQITSDPLPASPPFVAATENSIKVRIDDYLLPRLRRALRVGFAHLIATQQMQNRTTLTF